MIKDLDKTNLRPYREYKAVGVPNLEKVPSNWEARCLGQVGTLTKGIGGNKEDERPAGLPCVRYGDLYTTHRFFIEETRSFISQEDSIKYTKLKLGDVLFAASGETTEEIGKSAVNLMDEPGYCGGDIILFRPTVDLHPRYCGYALDCRPMAYQKAIMGRGFTVHHIYGRQLKYLRFPIPPPEEQTAIVRFLDQADEQIRRYIAGKERLIALLEEERQALVHQAVTRGLDPCVRLKPSGVEWLGDVPEHWAKRRLGDSVSGCTTGTWGEEPDGINDLACIRVADFDRHRRRVNTEKLTTRAITPAERRRRLLKPGNLLLEKSGGGDNQPVGTVVLYDLDIDAVTSNFVGKLEVRNGYYPHYLAFLHSTLYALGINKRSIKQTTGIQNIDVGLYLSEPVFFPPFDEQGAVAQHVNEATNNIDVAISGFRRQINLMTEYRARLIADVVTGQLDVRETAAQLEETST